MRYEGEDKKNGHCSFKNQSLIFCDPFISSHSFFVIWR